MKKHSDKELTNIDIALRRAAITAKAFADKTGTPYVVIDNANTKQLSSDRLPLPSTNNK